MIALAANGYSDLYALLEEGEVPVDFIKCPLSPDSRSEVAAARSYRPVLLHGWGPPGYSATRPEIPEPDLLVELTAVSGTPFISVHIDVDPAKDGPMSRTEALQKIREEVAKLKALTGQEILLENVPHYPWQGRPKFGTDPDFIAEAVVGSDAYFLLDTSHARVAAWHRDESIDDYLDGLPLDRIWEIHTSGPRMSEEGLRDRHMALTEEDYELVRHVLDRAPATKHLTLEYAGRRERTAHYNEPDGPELLRAQLMRLDQMRR